MQTEPDVLTEHNELICSTSIERVVSGRDAALLQIEQLIQQLDAISRLTSEVGGGTAQDWAMKAGHRYDSWLTETVDKAIPAVTRNIDRSIWRDLMLKSGMMALMDAEAREQWRQNLEECDLPTISEANVLSTFEQLHLNKMDVFERGIINVFKELSWDYKTNNPCSFGKKIIISNLVKYDKWGYNLNWGWQRDRLADLERMLTILEGQSIPDSRADVIRRLDDHIRENRHSTHYEDKMFSIKYFQKGTAHIIFNRPDLVDKLNDIIARHYPGMLAAR